MFNLNEEQRRVFRVAAVFAFAFCSATRSQIPPWPSGYGINSVFWPWGSALCVAAHSKARNIRGHRQGRQLILTQ
jgi:hypothetical protein